MPSVPSVSPSDYLLDINKVLLAMADNELLLNSSELSGGLYEDFSSQEDTLRVSHQSRLQPAKLKTVIVNRSLKVVYNKNRSNVLIETLVRAFQSKVFTKP